VNEFYYNYTPYSAEAYKSLDQKTLRTCNLSRITNSADFNLLRKKMIIQDYLPVQNRKHIDLELLIKHGRLVFHQKGKALFQVGVKEFLISPGRYLKDFSSRTDKYGFFRLFTLFSILIGLPISVYILLFNLCNVLLSLYFKIDVSAYVASFLCLSIGLVFLAVFHTNRWESLDSKDLSRALSSEHLKTRVSALRIIAEKRMEISDFPEYEKSRNSPSVLERYWLVKALGSSRDRSTYEHLLAFLNDPHRNVVCMAYYSLGLRGVHKAVDEILRRFPSLDDWYTQWYAYKALRRLGWVQSTLN